MKKFLPLFFVIFAIACKNNETKKVTSLEKNASEISNTIVYDFLSSPKTLETSKESNPITTFIEAAEKVASKTAIVNKENISQLLSDASKYQYCVVTTANHTIVKIANLNDCKQSGAWATCMPKAVGYIKKGALLAQNDYMNNIIGVPDAQVRKIFFFK